MTFTIFPGSIRFKIMLAATLLLVGGVSSVVWLSSNLYSRDAKAFILKSNSENAEALGNIFRIEIQHLLDRGRSLGVQALQKNQKDLSALVEGDSYIVGIQIIDQATGEINYRGFAKGFEDIGKLPPQHDLFAQFTGQKIFYAPVAFREQRLHEIMTPLQMEGETIKSILVLHINPKLLAASFRGDGVSELALFDNQGQVLIKSESVPGDSVITANGVPAELQQAAAASPLTNGVVTLPIAGRGNFLGSFYKSGVADVAVAVLTSESKAFEATRIVARRSAYLGLAILALALTFALLFGESLVRPIKNLVDATKKLSDGDYTARADILTRDELASLSLAFNDMAFGLAEKERLKTVFNKFHSKAVVDKLLGEDKVRLGGDRLHATIFFSDIRSFTSSSEQMSPEEVVQMLNEYFTKMVAVVEKYNGVVDKYIGDAIMAVWGITEKDPSLNAENALRAALEMRTELVQLNLDRAARGQAPIKIGIGLNSGEVISGNIGSPSRMEFSVIGDTVNTASRMESLTKDFATDLLLHESVVKLVPDIFAFSEGKEASAKGKSEKFLIYECSGLKSAMPPLELPKDEAA